MEPIPVEFTFTPEIFTKAQRFIIWNYLSKGVMRWILIALAIIWTVKLLVFNSVAEWLLAMGIAALLLFLWWFIFLWMSRRSFAKNNTLSHPIRYLFSEENVQLNTQNAQSVLQWATFEKALELPDLFLLQQNRVAVNPVLNPASNRQRIWIDFGTYCAKKVCLFELAHKKSAR